MSLRSAICDASVRVRRPAGPRDIGSFVHKKNRTPYRSYSKHAASGDLENPGSRKLPCCVPSRARLGALAQRPNDMWDHNSYAGASPTRYLDCTYVIGALSPREQSTLGPSPFQLQSSHPHGEWNQVMAEHVECMAVMQPSIRLLYASKARTEVRSASRLAR